VIHRLAWSLLLVPALAHAQGGDIIVTGRGLDSAPGDAAYDIVTIDRDRLTGSASGRLEDVLRDVAGLQQFRRADARSANPTSQGITLRGLGGNASSRALLVLDGVPQSDPFGGWVSFGAYAPERLDSVRVTRGGGSGVFGPGALAGTIELSSAGPDALRGVNAGLAYGSRRSVDADASLSAVLGSGFATLSADYARGDGFAPVIAAQRGPVDRPAEYEQASLSARAVVPVGDATEVQASVLAFADTRERGFAFSDNRSDGADASLRVVHRGRWGWSALAYVQARGFESSFASIDQGRTTATQTLDQYSTPATGLGARAEIRPPVGDRAQLRLGSDWRRTSGRTQERYTFVAGAPTRGRAAGGTTDTVGAFAELSLEAGNGITLTGGARVDRWTISGGYLRERTLATGAILTDTVFPDRSGWEPTGRIGAAWALSDTVTLRAAGYTGWRLPTLNELYRPFRVGADATAANALLSPERLRGVEAGIDYRPVEGARIAVTLFGNRLENAIANVTLAQGPGTFPGVGFLSAAGAYRQRQNLSAVESKGVELDLSASIDAFRLTASYAFADTEVEASGPAAALDGLRPAQTPRHAASATIGWEPRDGLSAAMTARYVSAQFEDDQNSVALADAVTFDARVALALTPRLSLELRGENLTDTRVEAAISGSGIVERATPRTLWVGVRIGEM
jgi:vitamin B12 transporter